MKHLMKFLLVSGAACALSVTVTASEDTHGTVSRVFDDTTQSHEPVDHAPVTHTASANEHDPAPADHVSHWGYEGAGGPDQWGSLKADYHLCSAGKMQSPVDIENGVSVKTPEIAFNYAATGLTIGNNGHTIQVDYGIGSHITVDGRRFDLKQFHFHTPSEHLIDGKTYPMEMHLVHANANGELAVVGIMFESGAESIVLSEIWNHLPREAGHPEQVPGVVINARDLLPASRQYHHYKGSLTTPPCSEGVNWFVMDASIQVGATQISKFMKIVGENARPVQAAQNRLFISGK